MESQYKFPREVYSILYYQIWQTVRLTLYWTPQWIKLICSCRFFYFLIIGEFREIWFVTCNLIYKKRKIILRLGVTFGNWANEWNNTDIGRRKWEVLYTYPYNSPSSQIGDYLKKWYVFLRCLVWFNCFNCFSLKYLCWMLKDREYTN